MTKPKPKLSREAQARLDEHARKSAEAMRRAATSRRAPARAMPPHQSLPSDAPRQPAKSRRGKKAVVVYLSEDAKALYAKIATEQRMTAQELGALAVNLMFQHFRSKPIA